MQDRTQPPTSPDEDDAYFRAVLLDLVERGQALARAIHERATAASPAADPAADPTVAFDRVARAVRRCIALARHIRDNPAGTAQAASTHRAVARARLIRGVEDTIDSRRRNKHAPPIDAEKLTREFATIMENPATEFDLGTRPVEEILEEILRDLNINNSKSNIYKRRGPAERDALRRRAATPFGTPRTPAAEPTPRPRRSTDAPLS